MTALVRYEAARSALAEAHRVDEVKDIRDRAEAMAAYARQAKDSELIQYATEIKVRAERRCGELLRTVERSGGGRPPDNSSKRETSYQQTLNENDIPRATADRYQQLAAMPADHFETAVATAKATAGEVTTAFMLREAKRRAPPKKLTKAAKARLEKLDATRHTSMLVTYARLTLTALRSQSSFTAAEAAILGELLDAIQQVGVMEC